MLFLFAISEIVFDDPTPRISQPKSLKCFKHVPSLDPMSKIFLIFSLLNSFNIN